MYNQDIKEGRLSNWNYEYTLFCHTAREGSMTKAAEKLHVTQPTLSKQIKELEEELGQKLFIRGNYNIHLTPEGRNSL